MFNLFCGCWKVPCRPCRPKCERKEWDSCSCQKPCHNSCHNRENWSCQHCHKSNFQNEWNWNFEDFDFDDNRFQQNNMNGFENGGCRGVRPIFINHNFGRFGNDCDLTVLNPDITTGD